MRWSAPYSALSMMAPGVMTVGFASINLPGDSHLREGQRMRKETDAVSGEGRNSRQTVVSQTPTRLMIRGQLDPVRTDLSLPGLFRLEPGRDRHGVREHKNKTPKKTIKPKKKKKKKEKNPRKTQNKDSREEILGWVCGCGVDCGCGM